MERETDTRAGLYLLLATCLREAPDAALLRRLREIEFESTDAAFDAALTALREAAGASDSDALHEEYHELFIGVTQGRLVPYASWYLRGHLHDEPLTVLRDDLRSLGLARSSGHSEPEDHVAAVCEAMAMLVLQGTVVQRAFFRRHLASWMDRFFDDLSRKAENRFYQSVACLGRAFLDLERRYLDAVTPLPRCGDWQSR